ncbi:MAG: 4-alpha-glucanotransferase [Pseudomonadota bacterium]|nr:4-alpha-glucanotransferase [Pseudomonadota bacterium]
MGARRRHAGVLLHPSSLPGPGPIGEIGPYADAFLEWMTQAGLDSWQVLPLHPVGPGASPYASPSAFAADPRLIAIETLVGDGILEPAAMPWGQERADFDAVDTWKIPLLRTAAGRVANDPACRAYVEAERDWLEDWALYAALARVYGGGWWVWPADAARRRGLAKLRKEHAALVAEEEALQWLFHVQWSRVRASAARRGIRLIGDIPIFVSGDGCDTWAHRDLFRLRPDGRPDPVAGVPPDYFSPLGQRWGNPTYAWDRHAATGFAWWTARLRREIALVDAVRLDHFRGFLASWSIPASEEDARVGHWESGPGRPLFDALQASLGALPVIAEDLGVITPDVAELRDSLGLPGMKVLQFAYGDDADHPFLPHNFEHPRWVAYTGTHDNDTVAGWYASTDERTRHRFRVTCGRDGTAPAWSMMREVWGSIAETAIAPMQDFLGLGSDARLNTPGAAEGNWGWRLRDLPWQVCGMSRTLGEVFGRTPGDSFAT